ncbi:MAG: beta-galactosidase, partial [Erysipelothrix sp.]|nr:beta-galactosidase [Erysipelothrix sp.]
QEDMRMFKLADLNTATINVFSWARLQPSEEIYDFEQMDRIVDMLTKQGYDIVMGTSTAALPAWLCHRYPEVTRTSLEGIKNRFGHRHNHCPNSPVFKHYASELVEKTVERYKDNENITVWHISNEYSGICFCDNCERAFRVWLKKKYKTLDKLNKAWNTDFWGHTFYSWEEIVVPDARGDAIGYDDSAFAGISIDYNRFNSDALLDNYIMERDIIKATLPDAVCTTNFMGKYKQLDYFKWAKELDIISWDSYPSYNTPISESSSNNALMRSLKQGQPFMLMEQTPSQQNWQPYNSLKKPGQMRAQSYQIIAHGADTIQYFQLRRSIGGCEKFHGALIDHVGNEHTRVFKEVAALGSELDKLGDTILGSRVKSQVAIVYDWDNYWALEYTSGPHKDLKYNSQIQKYYDVFYERNINVDFISVEDDMSQYDLVVAPVLYMVKEGHAERIESYVEYGGVFLTSFMSGIVDQSDNVHLGGYPGPLKDVLGIWVEEFDAIAPGMSNSVEMNSKAYTCDLICDIIHLRGAKSLAEYTSDFYTGTPVVTKNTYGKGEAFYVGSSLTPDFLDALLDETIERLEIESYGTTSHNLEVISRVNDKGQEIIFLINHESFDQTMSDLFVGETDVLTGNKISETELFKGFDVKIIVR